jgi:thioredoxin reductase
MPKAEARRIAVLGAGPIGLEAALYARSLNLPVTLYERGRVGDHVHRWGHVRMFSPFGMNSTRLGRAAILAENPQHEFPAEGTCVTGEEHLAVYLEPLAKTAPLREFLRIDTKVQQVSRRGLLKEDLPGDAKRGAQPFRILVREGKGRERIDDADVVLDCTGTYGQHRWMGDGGIPAVGEAACEAQIAYGVENILGDRRSLYAGKTVLVVGGGYSAATTVSNLAELAEDQPDTWIIWLARCSSTQPISRHPNDPLRERDRLAVRANTLATRGDGNVEFHNQCFIESLESAGPDKGIRMTTRYAGKERTWEAERLIANVGYTPDTGIYRELQVRECYASLGPASLSTALIRQTRADTDGSALLPASALSQPEPNFFILGAKSYGRNSQFLLRAGFEQIRQVFSSIMGKDDLNLYQGR